MPKFNIKVLVEFDWEAEAKDELEAEVMALDWEELNDGYMISEIIIERATD